MIILGLVGIKHSGKDTFSDLVKSVHPKTVKMGFADPLKSEICIAINSVNALYGSPTHATITPEFINKNKSKFRNILQWWGTDYRREMCSETYWIERTLKRINELDSKDIEYLIFPDVRFLNEAKMVKEVEGYLIKINRETGNPLDFHKSETELANIKTDFTIDNNATISAFKYSIETILSRIQETEKSLKT